MKIEAASCGREVRTASRLCTILLGLLLGVPGTVPALSPDGITSRASVDSEGGEADGPSSSPVLALEGRLVAFVSSAPSLLGDPNQGGNAVFLRDRTTGLTTRLISPSPLVSAIPGPGMSPGGAYLLYTRAASGGTPAQVWGIALPAGAPVLLSGPGDSASPAVADTGTYVLETLADDLGGAPAFWDVVRGQFGSPPDRLVSLTRSGAAAGGNSNQPDLSDDGVWVAFRSEAPDIVSGDTNGKEDIFLRDMRDTTPPLLITRVSVSSTGDEADGASDGPAISGSGRYVAFSSFATNLVAGDGNGVGDVFVHDRTTGETVRVSVDDAGNEAGGGFLHIGSFDAAIDATGRYVAFWSDASNLVPDDLNGQPDVFLHDRDTDEDGILDEPGAISTIRVSISSEGLEADAGSQRPALSLSGRVVAFESSATNLVPGDGNASQDVFVRDPGLPRALERVAVGDPGNPPDAGGRGSVGQRFEIGRFEVTNAQYAEFLNSVDPNGANPLGLHAPLMEQDPDAGGIREDTRAAPGHRYVAKLGFADLPVSYVSWFDAVRFVNWLEGGAQGFADTETGSYDLTALAPADPNSWAGVIRDPAAAWVLPSEDEWYKAAYHDPNDPAADGLGTADFWLLPVRSDTAVCTTPALGGAQPSASCGGVVGAPVEVGSYPWSSFHGTFDQGGNVDEWVETAGPGVSRTVRGGSFADPLATLESGDSAHPFPFQEDAHTGFRVVARDHDSDGWASFEDLCPFTADPDQLDSGGVADPGDPGGDAPDGIGDACQCGDATGDGKVDAGDLLLLREALAQLPGATVPASLCSVAGSAADCDLLDVVVLRRAQAGAGPGVAQVCEAARPAP